MVNETKSSIPKPSREVLNGQRILAEAKQLFIEHEGPEGVNMHQIAKAAGVGQATLYRRYAEIGDLCMDVVKEECRPLFDELEKYLQANAELPPMDKLRYIIERFAGFLEDKSPWLCNVSRAILGYRPMQTPLYEWMRHACRALLSEAKQRGEITADTDIAYTVEALLSTLHDLDLYIKNHGLTLERIVQGLHRTFIAGLKH